MDPLKKEFLELSDKFYKRFTERIEGLSDEEYLWEPVPDCWSLERRDDGKLHMRWGLVFDEPAPFTTIAWRYTHIIDLLSEERCAKMIGLDAEPEDLFADGAPGDVRRAREMFEQAFARWKRYITAADAGALFDQMGPVARAWADRPRAQFVLHILDEAIHHGAEIGVLRDLYRAQHEHDPDLSALLRGEDVSPAALEDVRSRRPDLVLYAAATARWDAIPHLLGLGFGVEGRDGRTPLHHAAADGRLDTMQLLIDAGADMRARDSVYKATPTEWAAFFDRREAVDLLRSAENVSKEEARAKIERDWDRWIDAIEAIPESRTREEGVAGHWTVHDVVGHVQSYARFYLVQARGAMTGRVPDPKEWNGDREEPPDGDLEETVDVRNERLRIATLPLSWRQLLDEAGWLRTETLGFLDALGDDQIAETVGWVPYWDPTFPREDGDDMRLIVRRASEVEGLSNPQPVWRFVRVRDHMDEHLAQIDAWLPAKATTTVES